MDELQQIQPSIDVLSVLRVVPPDVLRDGLWNVLPSASRVAFRQTCSGCDAWVRHNLTTVSNVIFNHLYLESLGSSGRSLAQHFPLLRSLTLRQAPAGRKPLPYQVVRACLELLCHGSDTPNDSHALRTSFRYVRELVLHDWPSVGSDELALLAEACPCVEHFTVICRTRSFTNCFDIPADLPHALTAHFPHLRRLQLRGIGLELVLLLIQQQSQQPQSQQQQQPPPPSRKEQQPERQEQRSALKMAPDSSGDSGGSRDSDNSMLGLRVLSRLTQLESFVLGVVDPPPRLLYDLGFWGCQLRVLKLEVCLVMTPYQKFRRVAMAAGEAVARLESLHQLGVEFVAWKKKEHRGRCTGLMPKLAGDMWRPCEDDEGLIDVDDWGKEEEDEAGLIDGKEEEDEAGLIDGKEEEDEAGEAGGGTEGAVGREESLLMAFLRPVVGAARRAQRQHQHQTRQCDSGVGSDGRIRGSGGTAIRVICLPCHKLRLGDWCLLRQLPSLSRLEVGGMARELKEAVQGSGVEVVMMGRLAS